MILGVLLFSKVVDFTLEHYEMPTRFCFLGLIVGTLPMVWKEVRKEGFAWWHYLVIAAAAGGGFWYFPLRDSQYAQRELPTWLEWRVGGIHCVDDRRLCGVVCAGKDGEAALVICACRTDAFAV